MNGIVHVRPGANHAFPSALPDDLGVSGLALERPFVTLLRDFPARAQLGIVVDRCVLFDQVNERPREAPGSFLYRTALAGAARLLGGEGGTFRRRIDRRYNVRSVAKSVTRSITFGRGRPALRRSILSEDLPSHFTSCLTGNWSWSGRIPDRGGRANASRSATS